jgi:hypothetical protein
MRRLLVLVALACAACASGSSEPEFREDRLREEMERQGSISSDSANGADALVRLVRSFCAQDEDLQRAALAEARASGDTEWLALTDAACPLGG